MKNEGLKLSSLRRIASAKMTDTPALNNAILLARALVQRPRLIDAILDEEERRLPKVKALIDELRVEIG